MSDTEEKAGKRVLVVDDSLAARELAEAKLESLGFSVLTAANGRECLQVARAEKPDLILLDIMMPGMDGATTAERLLDDPVTKDIPVIFLTSMISEREEKHRLGQIGGQLFVAKPFDEERLMTAIKKALASAV
jgi:two-component system cell cycle response regulator